MLKKEGSNEQKRSKKKKFKNPEKRSGPLAQFHHQRSRDHHRGLALLGSSSENHDLTLIGQGTNVVVQVHDPG